MSAQERSNIIIRVEQTRWGKRKLLTQLQVPKSTYYRWRARELQGKQDSSTASTRIPRNKLSSPEEAAVLAAARESPEWSSRQLATWITDHESLSVGESTVYRLLKREGLVKPPEMQLLAVKSTNARPAVRIRCGLPMLHISGWPAGAITTWSP